MEKNQTIIDAVKEYLTQPQNEDFFSYPSDNEDHSDNENFETRMESSKLCFESLKENLTIHKSKKILDFLFELQNIWQKNRNYIHCNKLPQMANKKLDVYDLFISVKELGGYDKCTKLNLWKDVLTLLRFPMQFKKKVHQDSIQKKYVELSQIEMEQNYLGINHTAILQEESSEQAKEDQQMPQFWEIFSKKFL